MNNAFQFNDFWAVILVLYLSLNLLYQWQCVCGFVLDRNPNSRMDLNEIWQEVFLEGKVLGWASIPYPWGMGPKRGFIGVYPPNSFLVRLYTPPPITDLTHYNLTILSILCLASCYNITAHDLFLMSCLL